MQWFPLVCMTVVLLGEETLARRQVRRRVSSVRGRTVQDSSFRWHQEGTLTRFVQRHPFSNVRPVLNTSLPVRVGHGLSLVALSAEQVAGGPMSVTVTAGIRQVWVDTRLVWDPTRSKIEKLHLRSTNIWTPEVDVFPSLSSSNDLSHSKHDVIVTPSGSVTWSYQATYQVPCIITPAKMVNCSLRVWTPHYDVSEIAHVPISDVIDLSHYVTSDMYPITTSGSEEELLTMTSMSQHTYSVVRYRFSTSFSMK